MAKKSISYLKLFLTGIVWIPLYAFLFIRFYQNFFRFNCLSSTDWKIRLDAFMSGKWVITTSYDWGFLIGLILFIPILLLGLICFYRVKWKKFFRKKKIVVLPKQNNPTIQPKKAFEPAKMRVQTSAILTVSTTPQNTQPQSSGVQPIPSIPQVGMPQSQPTTSQYEDEADVQQMLALTSGLSADFFPHITIDGAYASFALSTEHQAAVVKLINQPDSVWAVDTEIEIEQSDWFDQTSSMPAPGKDILTIVRNLQENEPESNAIPVILLMSGKLLNVDETLDYFEKNNVLLLRLENVENEEIPLFSDFIKEFFEQQTQEGLTP